MTRAAKRADRVTSIPADLSWDELKAFLEDHGYVADQGGKTSGSRVRMVHKRAGDKIVIHKPHNPPVVKRYVIRQVLEQLRSQGHLT